MRKTGGMVGGNMASISDGKARIIYTVTVTSWLVIGVSLVWCLLGILTAQWVILWIATFVLVFTVVSLTLVKRGHDLIGRILWYVCGMCGVTAGVFIVHPEGHVATMYVALLGGPFLTFSIYKERAYLAALVIGVFAVWMATRIMGHDFFGPPLLDAEFARQYVSGLSVGTTFLVVTFEMAVFASLMNGYIERLRASRQAADVANRAKSEFLAAMSHEIRTPMNGVVSMVEILDKTDLTKDQRRILQTVQESSESLLRIIEDILDMSRIEAGRLDLIEEPADLLRTVEAAVDTLRSYADTNNVYVSLHVDLTLPRLITCDAGRLRQVLLNLLGNAIKFSSRPPDQPGGEVRLSVIQHGPGQMRLVVEDNGIGMSEEFQNHLFEPFRQSRDATSRRFGGSGLGLAIVQQLVTKMQGTITARSTSGKGAEFTVVLPMKHPQGALDVPDLEGATLYVYRPANWHRVVGDRYAAACNGVLEVLETRADLWAHGNDTQAVFILDMKLDATSERWSLVNAFRVDFPDARTLVLSRERGSPTGALSNGALVLQAGPLLPSELWSALRQVRRRKPGETTVGLRPEVAVAAPPTGRRLRVLIAEDNEINQIVIGRQIEQLGHVATMVSDGHAALDEWRAGGHDIILTDCQMPGMDGFALTREIRAVEQASKTGAPIPIVAITANALSGEADRCRAEGMDGYLAKPVKLSDLKVLIDKLVAPPTVA